jgi:hypothetical protein
LVAAILPPEFMPPNDAGCNGIPMDAEGRKDIKKTRISAGFWTF